MTQSKQSQPVQEVDYKVILVGDGGVGKSSLIRKLVTGEYEIEYNPTLGVEVHPVDFSTPAGNVRFFCWDTAGQEKFGGLRDGYYESADAAIILFDVGARTTYKNVPTWFKDITRVCGDDLPIVVCGNKTDLKTRQVKPDAMRWPKEMKDKFEYFETTVESVTTILRPFAYLLKKLAGPQAELLGEFSQEPAASGAAAQTPKATRDQQRQRHVKARNTPLPE